MRPRPVIGITSGSGGMPIAEGVLASHYVSVEHTRAIHDAGGLSMMLPAIEGSEDRDAAEVVALVDGLLLAGGTDIHPESYGAEMNPDHTRDPDPVRDRFEIALVREARNAGTPILGICRGLQMLNVAYGGTLDQHRPHPQPTLVKSEALRIVATDLSVLDGSALRAALGTDSMKVFCIHHQAVDRIGEGLRISSSAADGTIEGLEDPDAPFVMGVLWHPEHMDGSIDAQRVYDVFVDAARRPPSD